MWSRSASMLMLDRSQGRILLCMRAWSAKQTAVRGGETDTGRTALVVVTCGSPGQAPISIATPPINSPVMPRNSWTRFAATSCSRALPVSDYLEAQGIRARVRQDVSETVRVVFASAPVSTGSLQRSLLELQYAANGFHGNVHDLRCIHHDAAPRDLDSVHCQFVGAYVSRISSTAPSKLHHLMRHGASISPPR